MVVNQGGKKSMGVTRDFADFIADTDFGDLPEDVVNCAKTCCLDWIGSALAGYAHEHAKVFLRTGRDLGGERQATIIGSGDKISCPNAALVNSAISYILKLDQSSPHGCGVHPQVCMIPAALATAERNRSSGKDLIVAIVLGFDIETRIAMGIQPSHYRDRFFHATGTCGTFGAAAAAGKLLRLNTEQMVNVLGMAGTQASGLKAALTGMGRLLHAGKAAYSGVLAALLAQNGFVGVTDIIESEQGFCHAMSNEYNLSTMVGELGERYEITNQRFVRYCSCGGMHAAIDAVIDLVGTYDIKPDDIAVIEARAFPVIAEGGVLASQLPATPYEAQFSVPYALAVAAIDGDAGIPQFSCERIGDPKVRDLARRVRVEIDPEYSAIGYAGTFEIGVVGAGEMINSSKVCIRMRDGKEYRQRVDNQKGSPQNPLNEEELLRKFRMLAVPVLTERRAEDVIGIVRKLENVDDISDLTDLLC